MNRQNLKNKSRNSSESSGSLKLMPEHDIEKYRLKISPSKDLFDLLLDESCTFSQNESILRTIS